jgi:hypothetical protein
MPKKNKLQQALAGKKRNLKEIQAKTQEEMKEVMGTDTLHQGLKYKRTNFYMSYNSDARLEDLSKRLKRQTGVNISKSLLVEFGIKLLEEYDQDKLLVEIEKEAKARAIDLL